MQIKFLEVFKIGKYDSVDYAGYQGAICIVERGKYRVQILVTGDINNWFELYLQEATNAGWKDKMTIFEGFIRYNLFAAIELAFEILEQTEKEKL